MESQSALATRLLATRYGDIASSVLIEIVNNLTFAEFYEIYAQAKPNSRIALDNPELVEFLLAGNDDGKKLVVALFSGGGGLAYEGVTPNTAISLGNLSRAHRVALLSNVRVDWYSILSFHHKGAVRTELLAPAILSDDQDEKLALLRNPRMDRRFVADVIRGKNEFHAIPAPNRFWYGLVSIKVKEIESEDYPGKDSPDSNEMHFHEPEESLLAAIREVLPDTTTIQRFSFYLEDITRLYGKTSLKIEHEDWLSDDQKREAERISDWSARYKAKHRMALRNFINWVSSWSVNEPQIPKAKEDDKELDFEARYIKGTLAVTLSFKAFCGLSDEEITKGLTLRNWCVRAGAFAARYAKLGTKDRSKLLTEYAKDSYALVRGLASGENFWKTCEGSGGLESVLGKHEIEINDETRRYLEYHVREMVYPEYKEDDGLGTNGSYPEEPGVAADGREHLTTSTKSGVVIGYVWRVLINVFYVAVVLYVFDKLQGRSEAIVVVAVLGLIYVTIRSIAISQGVGLANALKVIESDIIRLRELVRDDQARHRLDASKADSEVISRERNKLFIDGFFLSIVSIICLFALFGELRK